VPGALSARCEDIDIVRSIRQHHGEAEPAAAFAIGPVGWAMATLAGDPDKRRWASEWAAAAHEESEILLYTCCTHAYDRATSAQRPARLLEKAG